ncbi:MAG: preprotein translocase subunit YajC [Candidatus Latescibacterota bacterium]|nr:MAG: preprotein translocase subunit YajC [Candidatus Latescibacterota bacterium]
MTFETMRVDPMGLIPAVAGEPGSMFPLLSMFLVFLVLYFLMIRPQARRQKERDQMLKKVGKGDRIVTTGGLYGTIVSTRGNDVLVVKIAENVRVEMARPAVASIVSSGEKTDAS